MANYTQEYESLSRQDLEKEDKKLAEQRTEIRERQVAVTGLLDAHRAMAQMNLPPETVKQMYRLAEIRSAGTGKSEAKQ